MKAVCGALLGVGTIWQTRFAVVRTNLTCSRLGAEKRAVGPGEVTPFDVAMVRGAVEADQSRQMLPMSFDHSLRRLVAIRVLPRQPASSPTARRRFMREAHAAFAINHPHVVTIHAVEECAWQPYLVMEFVDGRSLYERIREKAPLPLVS